MIELKMNWESRPASGLLEKRVAMIAGRLAIWRRNHRTRQQLPRLNHQQLVDIGLRPDDRASECRKWFWQE